MATATGNYRVTVTNTITGCSKTTASVTTVTVNALPSATITPQGPTTFCAGGSVLLKGNGGTGLLYKWKKNGAAISGATNKNYTAHTAGTYRVQVTNSNGCSKVSAGIVVTVPCKLSESESDGVPITIGIDMNVYPNPTGGEITIQFADKPDAPIQIELTDMPGKVIERFEVTEQTVLLNKSDLANGIYFLSARNKNGMMVRKIVISR
jgi:hypothetical protein